MDKKEYINNPHDKIIRKILMNKKEGKAFINKALNLKEEEKLKEKNIENYTNSYVSNELKNKISDVVYKVINANMYVVIEHQTKKDKIMKKRIWHYKSEIIRKLLDDELEEQKLENKNYINPKVVGIVLYTGKEKWSNEANKIKNEEDKMTLDDWKTQDIMDYELVDAKEIDEEKLLEERSMLSKVLLIERLQNIDEARELAKKIMKQDMSKEMRERINLYMIVLIAQNLKMPQSEVKKIIKNRREVGKMQVDEMLQREARRLRKEGRIQGRAQGIAVGEARGDTKRKLAIIRNMIIKKVKDDIIMDCTEISDNELRQIKQELVRQNA